MLFSHCINTQNVSKTRESLQLSQYIVTRLWGGRPEFNSWQVLGIFSPHHIVQTGCGAHPASYPMSAGGFFPPGVKWPVREADHPLPSSAEVNNAWSYISTPQYVLMAWCLIKHKDEFTFTLPPEISPVL